MKFRKLKQIVCAVMCGAVMFSACVINGVSATYTVCDINCDGKVNILDLLRMKMLVSDVTPKDLTEQGRQNADLNFDGKINILDLLLMKAVVGGAKTVDEIEKNRPTSSTTTTTTKTTTKATTTTTTTTTTTKVTTTTTTTNPNTDVVDPSYPTAHSDYVSVNQIGYSTDAAKTAKLFEESDVAEENSKINNAVCYVVDTSTNRVVYSGSAGKRNLDSLTEKYVSTFTFTTLKTAGTYKVCAPGGVSYTFKISDNPYNTVSQSLIDALYYQRCGVALDSSIVGSTYSHSACHTGSNQVIILDKYDSSSGKFVQSGTAVASDFAGGLHDAGDYGRYVTPACQTISDLLYTYLFYPETVTKDVIQDNSGEHISDALDEARYEAKWLLKMQAPSGGFYWRIVTKAFPGYYDTPDNDSSFKSNGLYVDRVMYESTAAAVGTLADCYYVFKNIDSAFANQCLEAAKKGYTQLATLKADSTRNCKFEDIGSNPSVTAGTYDGSMGAEAEWYAVSALYRATGNSEYATAATNYFNNSVKGTSRGTGLGAYDMSGYGSIAYLMNNNGDSTIKTSIKSKIEDYIGTYKTYTSRSRISCLLEPGTLYWGSNSGIACVINMMGYYSKITGSTSYDSTIRDNISHILGRNISGYSFVTGYGMKSTNNPHHRPSMAAKNKGATYCVPGLMSAGFSNINGAAFPPSDESKIFGTAYYNDVQGDYVCNEVCIYWNSPIASAISYIVSQDMK